MSWSDFFSLGGYGFYVWTSYAVALIAMGGEVIFLLRRKKTLTARFGRLEHPSEGEIHENKT